MKVRSAAPAIGVFAVTLLMCAPGRASAQTADRPLTPAQIVDACAPPASADQRAGALRVVGMQGTQPRMLYGRGDLIVTDGGTANEVQLGQQYFIRRQVYTDSARRARQGVITLAWVRIVAANATTSIGSVEGFCGAIYPGDHLEPFVAPAIVAGTNGPAGELDFTSLGRVMGGAENRISSGTGDFLVIDRGTDQGVATGLRFAVYRDLRIGGMPLSAVGEAVVVSTGKTTAVARVIESRDAVVAGDYVVPRK